MNLKHQFFRFNRVKEKIGFSNAIIFSFKWIFKKLFYSSTTEGILFKDNVLECYSFMKVSPFGDSKIEAMERKVLNWVIPDFGVGSGGHLNIFNMINLLEKRGYLCRIIIDGMTNFQHPDEALVSIHKNFYPIHAPVFLGANSMPPAWGTFATSWETAYTVKNFQGTKCKFYFIQDFEPYFFPRGSEYVFAEQTYRFGFHGITVGNWLAEKLKNQYNMTVYSCFYSYNKERYYPRKRLDPEKKRLLFYSRPVTPRRGFELGLLAIKELINQMPDVEVVFAGWDSSNYLIDFPYKDLGTLHHDDLPNLYSQCDAALVISLTDLSMLPIELMGCGCVVVSNRGENVEWFLNENVAVLSDPTPECLSSSLVKILSDNFHRAEIRDRALAYVKGTDWEKEVDGVVSFIESFD